MRMGYALLVAAVLSAAALAPSLAQPGFPSAPVKIVLGFPAGAFMDVIARVVGPGVGEILGQQIVIENRPGASTNLAAEAVVRSPNTGHTLLLGSSSNVMNTKLFASLAFDFSKDLEPVALTAAAPLILVVHPSLAVASVQDFVALTRSRPSQINYATNGRGTATMIAGQMFDQKAETSMVPVYYKGSNEALADLLTNRVQVMFSPASSVLPHVHSGALKALAVTSRNRSALAPDLPTLDEAGLSGYNLSIWIGIMAPAGTPREATDKVAAAFERVLGSPEIRSKIAAQGADVVFKGPRDFAAYIREDTDNWERISQMLRIKPE
jgi:tripartite-type tricarboxylate transporter receptor subunit TctC